MEKIVDWNNNLTFWRPEVNRNVSVALNYCSRSMYVFNVAIVAACIHTATNGETHTIWLMGGLNKQ